MAKQKFLLEDVAQAAGVSKSTVDRVLNGRPGVRASTLERVNAALERLGYAPNALARRIAPAAERVDILLPRNENLFFDDLVARLREEEARHDLDMRMVRMEGFDAPSLAAALNGISEETRAVIAVALDAPEVRDAVDRLEARGTRVVTLVSDVPQSRRSAYIGFDNFAAGRTAGALMALLVPPGAGSVAVLVGHLGLRDHLDRRSGFEQVIAERRPDLRVLQAGACRDLPELAQEMVARLLAETPDLTGLYVAGAGNRGVVAALAKAAPPGLAVVGHELTATTRAALLAGRYQAVIVQDTRELARRALDMALSPRAGDDPMDSRPLAIQIVVKENLPPAEF
ncbi:MAG: LacI family DNA-binding transcriptional regulator [Sphingomonadales bacterium]|nr:LacI family DNA-binding transcriptional regulator [Sphingomonadales bacterium]